MTNLSDEILSLSDEDVDVKTPIFRNYFYLITRYSFILLNLLSMGFFISVILLSLFIFIFIFLHISYLINFDPFNILSNFISLSGLYSYFFHIEYMFKNDIHYILDLVVSYILLMFILADITRYVITDQISSIYKSLDILINNRRYPNDKVPNFRNILLIIFSAILFEMFLKLFSCNHDDYINLAYLITGTMLSGAIFLYVIYSKGYDN